MNIVNDIDLIFNNIDTNHNNLKELKVSRAKVR